MATWAYECRPAAGAREPWHVACLVIDAMPAGIRIVRVQVDGEWVCAIVDRRERVVVDAMHLRDAVASDAADCPDCARGLNPPAAPAPAQEPELPRSGRELQAAAMSVQGHRFIVVLVSLDLVQRPGEADMAIADLRPRFGGVEVVLMGQEEDGTPSYHGHETLVELLGHIPVDKMPWKAYPVG